MADLLGGVGAVADKAVSTGASIVWGLVWFVLIFGLIFLFIWFKSYGFRKVILFQKSSNGIIMKSFKAKQFKSRGNIKKWKLFSDWRSTEQPPDECVFPDQRGRLTAIGALIEDNIVWFKTTDVDFSSGSLARINFEPFVAADRASLAHEYREADEYKKKKLGDILLSAAPIIAIVIILSVFMIFFNDTVKPTRELGEKLTVVADKIDKSLYRIDSIINNKIELNEEGVVRSSPPG